MENKWDNERARIIGLGDDSFRKSYYPELQAKIQALTESSNNFELLFEGVTDCIFIHDINGRIIKMNKRARELFEIPDEPSEEYSIFNITPEKADKLELLSVWSDVLKGENFTFYREGVSLKTKTIINIQVSLSSVIWFDTPAIVAVIRDFRERIEYESQLIEAKSKAEESDRLKSAFLANLSHEIRTPMNGILGFTQLLKNLSHLNPDALSYIDTIEESGKRLLGIINDLLDISRIEAGQAELRLDLFSPLEMLEYIFKANLEQANARNLDFRLVDLPERDFYIQTDKEKIYAILNNLVQNALKYTNQGYVEVGCTYDKDNICYYVKDTGIGIPENEHEKVFDRFVQASSKKDNFYEGAGLGLSIVKGYVDLLKGKIELISEYGKGSEFRVTLPIIDPAKIDQDKQQMHKGEALFNDFSNSKALIVEDDDASTIYLERILKTKINQIYHVDNGIDAVEFARNNTSLDLILMDIKLPGIDGLTATKKIREFNSNVIIIAQSAYAMVSDKEKSIDAGCNDHISKPINSAELMSIISQQLAKK